MKQFCAYVHARPDGRIFYVGKGDISRAKSLRRPGNTHHTNIVRKYGAQNILVGKLECSTETLALELEVGLLKCLRRMGVPLTNKTDGGEGVSGLKFSEESKKRLSLIQTRLNNLPERKEAFRAQIKGNQYLLGHRHSDETKKLLSIAGRGRAHSSATKEAIAAAQRGNLNHRYGKPAHNKGMPMTDEQKLLLSTRNLGKFCITNGGKNLVLNKGEDVSAYLASGWRYGMTKKKKWKRSKKA